MWSWVDTEMTKGKVPEKSVLKTKGGISSGVISPTKFHCTVMYLNGKQINDVGE